MIREALLDDVITINNFGKNIISNFSTTYNIKDYINNDKYIILVSGEIDINGFLIVLKNFDSFELEMIYVDEKYRQKGIASSLLDYFITNYTKSNNEIFLEVSVDNYNAIKLYEKFAFSKINIRKNYYKNSDAYVMKKVIK